MEKKVTKEEVERVFLNNFPIIDRIKLKKSLNELFHPEFRVRDWVVGWHNNREGLRDNAWQIELFDKHGQAVPNGKKGYGTTIECLRHATSEEIAAAEWEGGKPYKVWREGEPIVYISSDKVGFFYGSGRFDGRSYEYDKYEKL